MSPATWTWTEMNSRRIFSIINAAWALLLAPRRLRSAFSAATNYRSFFPYLLASLLLCPVPVLVSAQQENQPTIRFVRNPDPAPDFTLTSLDGKPLTLAGSKGKVILLNFWATWCGPCRAEIPDLVELQNKYKDRLHILGLVVNDDDQAAIKKFVAESGINYPVAIATTE